jgi:energy-converting hydrogenase A subunit M
MSSSTNELSDRLLVFGMKNILLEGALQDLESKGIDTGHPPSTSKEQTVDTEMFEHDILVRARRMADFYVLYFALENSVRRLITEVLSERYGTEWWAKAVPQGVRNSVEQKQKEERETAMSIRSDDPLAYSNFGELIDIVNSNWDEFAEVLRSQRAVQDTLSQFNKIRNIIAHSCELNDDEIARFALLIRDWIRIQT